MTTQLELAPYGRLESRQDIRNYLFGGNATLTLVSKASGRRYTYKVKSAPLDRTQQWSTNNQNRNMFFVSLLTGSDNDSSYTYFGQLVRVEPSGHAFKYMHGKKSTLKFDAPGVIAFRWFIRQVEEHKSLESTEVWHEGSCGRCGRKLTVPESIKSGVGPECASKEGL